MSFNIGGEGGTSFQFANPGDTCTGKVVTLTEVQQTDLDTGAPLTWENGSPRMMYQVTLQTEYRNGEGLPELDGPDTGIRTVFLRGSRKSESQSTLAAVLGAVKAATNGGTEINPGDMLSLTYSGNGQATGIGKNPPKLYTAQYRRGSVDLGGPQGPQAGGPAPEWAQPAQQQAPATDVWGQPVAQPQAAPAQGWQPPAQQPPAQQPAWGAPQSPAQQPPAQQWGQPPNQPPAAQPPAQQPPAQQWGQPPNQPPAAQPPAQPPVTAQRPW